MRPLLLGLLLCAAASQIGATGHAGKASTDKSIAPADVVIIGAGMAGITAGRYLADNSDAKVIILEARGRSGGRLFSVKTPYGRVDQGAMWIHDGMPGNALYDLAVKLGSPLSPEEDYFSSATFQSDGTPAADMSSRAFLYTGWLEDMIGRIEDMRSDPNSVDVSIYQIYQEFLAKNGLTPAQTETTNLIAHTNYQTLLNANMTELSSLRYGDAKILPAIDVLLKDGFDSLTNIMQAGLDIRYNTPVTAIEQDPTGVRVIAADGTVFYAKYAITTTSLGCLKEGKVRFDPPLPSEKLQAIADMGMGLLNKVILVYDKPFWNATDFISREMPDLGGEWSLFLNNNRTLEMPVLVALNAADTARRIEALSDEETLASIFSTLQSMYPESSQQIASPIQYFITRWASDPWSLGSYSFYAVGNSRNITDALAAPMGRLMFAGEAASEWPATVLGAYVSGLREGERVTGLLGAGVEQVKLAAVP